MSVQWSSQMGPLTPVRGFVVKTLPSVESEPPTSSTINSFIFRRSWSQNFLQQSFGLTSSGIKPKEIFSRITSDQAQNKLKFFLQSYLQICFTNELLTYNYAEKKWVRLAILSATAKIRLHHKRCHHMRSRYWPYQSRTHYGLPVHHWNRAVCKRHLPIEFFIWTERLNSNVIIFVVSCP